MSMIAHATRTSLRRLLLRKGIDVPPVRELTLRVNPHFRHYTPAFQLRWRDSEGKRHMAIYYFCGSHPHLEVDHKELPTAELELRMYGLYKEKE